MRALLCLPLLAWGASGCTIFGSSLARPVDRPTSGAVLIGAGMTVPLAYFADGALAGDFDLESAFGPSNFTPIPYGSFDIALSDYTLLGASAWYVDVNGQNQAGFVAPRLEFALDARLALTVEATFGALERDDGAINPWVSPAVGLRWAIPTGFGGFLLNQKVSTSFVTWGLTGSVAYDVPISLNEQFILHIFPELRWDPVIILEDIQNTSGALVPISAGLGVMVEIK